jgi:hypothetical protein
MPDLITSEDLRRQLEYLHCMILIDFSMILGIFFIVIITILTYAGN